MVATGRRRKYGLRFGRLGEERSPDPLMWLEISHASIEQSRNIARTSRGNP